MTARSLVLRRRPPGLPKRKVAGSSPTATLPPELRGRASAAIRPGETEARHTQRPGKRGLTAAAPVGNQRSRDGAGGELPAPHCLSFPSFPSSARRSFARTMIKGAEKAHRSPADAAGSGRTGPRKGTATTGRSRGYRRTRRGEGQAGYCTNTAAGAIPGNPAAEGEDSNNPPRGETFPGWSDNHYHFK